MKRSPLPLMFATGAIVSLDALAQGKPTARPIVSAFVVSIGLSLIGNGAPELAHGLALLIFTTALLTAGGRLAQRATGTQPQRTQPL